MKPEGGNTLFKKLLESEKPKAQGKLPMVTNNNFMMRKVHSFYNDHLFKEVQIIDWNSKQKKLWTYASIQILIFH